MGKGSTLLAVAARRRSKCNTVGWLATWAVACMTSAGGGGRTSGVGDLRCDRKGGGAGGVPCERRRPPTLADSACDSSSPLSTTTNDGDADITETDTLSQHPPTTAFYNQPHCALVTPALSASVFGSLPVLPQPSGPIASERSRVSSAQRRANRCVHPITIFTLLDRVFLHFSFLRRLAVGASLHSSPIACAPTGFHPILSIVPWPRLS